MSDDGSRLGAPEDQSRLAAVRYWQSAPLRTPFADVDGAGVWPEYYGGPLWSEDGKTVEPTSLGLAPDLSGRLAAWNARYDDSKLPFEQNDREWLDEGARLLTEVRAALGSDYELAVNEEWWGEQPNA